MLRRFTIVVHRDLIRAVGNVLAALEMTDQEDSLGRPLWVASGGGRYAVASGLWKPRQVRLLSDAALRAEARFDRRFSDKGGPANRALAMAALGEMVVADQARAPGSTRFLIVPGDNPRAALEAMGLRGLEQ